jgi:hypothetical protein
MKLLATPKKNEKARTFCFLIYLSPDKFCFFAFSVSADGLHSDTEGERKEERGAKSNQKFCQKINKTTMNVN